MNPPAEPPVSKPRGTPSRRRCTWALFVVLLTFHLTFQAMHGAWTSDLAGDPDEAAHAVTSLMLRDYLAGGWQQSPVVFAQNYYADFPKVALGHYPPGYYLLGGAWLLPFASIGSLFVLQSVLAALLGTLIFRIGSRILPVPAAAGAGLLSAALPFTLKQEAFVMSDLMLGVLCLLATAAWADYLHRPTNRRALAFGGLAALAILTKGSALALCLVPPVATLLSGRWQLIKRLSWWLSALPVMLLAGPWMLYSSRITAEGMIHQPLSDFVRQAAVFYATSMPHVVGWLLLVCILLGLSFVLRSCVRSPDGSALQASLIGLLAGVAAICLFVPAGFSTRYLLPALPTLLIVSVTAIHAICSRLPKGRWLAFYAVLITAISLTPRWPEKHVTGFADAVQSSGLPGMGSDRVNWLVASDPRGEGAIIAAAAFECIQRSPSLLRVYRGSKELSTSDWLGRGYQLTHPTEAALIDSLDEKHISRVFVDLSADESVRKEHERQLLRALDQAPDRWALDFAQNVSRSKSSSGQLLVYKRL